MIKILLVDDDVLVLTKIKQLIFFLKLNYQVVKDLTNAKEALEFLKIEEVDIIITDMKMPKMDGIELIKEAKIINKDIQIIAISSYEDFYYVKESLKEGSIDYILKHSLNEETLKYALYSAKNKISSNRKSQLYKLEQDNLIITSKVLLKKEFLTQLIKEEFDKDTIIKKFEYYDINIDYNNLVLIICEIDNYRVITENFNEKDKKIFNNAALDIICKTLENDRKIEAIYLKDGEYVLYISADTKSNLDTITKASKYAQRLRDNLKNLLNISISISISNFCYNIENISELYIKAKDKLKKKFFEGKGRVYNDFDMSISKVIKDVNEEIEYDEKEILNKLKRGDESLINDLESIFNKYKEERYPFDIIELKVLEMFNIGNEVIKEFKININMEKYSLSLLYRNIYKYETIEDIKQLMISFYETLISNVIKINNLLNFQYSKHTVKCITYIERNYKNIVSLQDAANFIGINAAYLSKIFKNDIGMNFIEYLNKYRIGISKELILTKNYSIKEISTMVGYENYNYFFKVFREITNLSPLEFEKKI